MKLHGAVNDIGAERLLELLLVLVFFSSIYLSVLFLTGTANVLDTVFIVMDIIECLECRQ